MTTPHGGNVTGAAAVAAAAAMGAVHASIIHQAASQGNGGGAPSVGIVSSVATAPSPQEPTYVNL